MIGPRASYRQRAEDQIKASEKALDKLAAMQGRSVEEAVAITSAFKAAIFMAADVADAIDALGQKLAPVIEQMEKFRESYEAHEAYRGVGRAGER